MIIERAMKQRQSGVLLIEAMIAVVVFAVGVLALVGLQAKAIQLNGEARYRSSAGQLTNKLFAEMWVSSHDPAVLITQYASAANGTGYTSWLNDVRSELAGEVDLTHKPPTVTVVSVPSAVAGGNAAAAVTVTIYWAPPQSFSNPATVQWHKYVATALIRSST